MFAVGLSLGVLCRYAPPQYQVPCSYVAKLLGIFMGAS